MTDDAIQDILEQTESDPAFQALFDLFDYGKIYRADLSRHSIYTSLLGTPANSCIYLTSQSCGGSTVHNVMQILVKSFRSNIRLGRSLISVTLTVPWLLVPDGLVRVFQKLLGLSHTSVCRVYTECCKSQKDLYYIAYRC